MKYYLCVTHESFCTQCDVPPYSSLDYRLPCQSTAYILSCHPLLLPNEVQYFHPVQYENDKVCISWSGPNICRSVGVCWPSPNARQCEPTMFSYSTYVCPASIGDLESMVLKYKQCNNIGEQKKRALPPHPKTVSVGRNAATRIRSNHGLITDQFD